MMRFFLVVMVAIGQGLAVRPSLAGAQNSVPFKDDFESYTNGTPLIDGINGWYASSSKAVVQTDVVKSDGTKAAMIPEDVTLSNRFENVGSTNVWIQMDVRPVRGDETDDIFAADTNVTAIFYVNSAGYFVVHDGSPANLITVTNTVAGAPAIPVPENEWVRVHVYQNYSNKTWTLFADHALMKENIRFVNSSATGFHGFDIYNSGGATTYVDNVAVMAHFPQELRAGNWLPDLMLGTNVLIGAVGTEETAGPTGLQLGKRAN